jgi:hypothetical protein
VLIVNAAPRFMVALTRGLLVAGTRSGGLP